PVSTVYRFDVISGRVDVIGRLAVPLGHAAAFALGSDVFVVGGRDGSDRALRSVYAIDPAHGRIRRLASLSAPVADAAATTVGHRGWLIGGWNGHTLSGVLQARLVQLRSHLPSRAIATRQHEQASAVPAPLSSNVYAATAVGRFSAAVRGLKQRVYVPNSRSGTVSVIDPTTFRVIRRFRAGLY